MQVLKVTGGHDLGGSVAVHGAKNSVLKLMSAALLATGETVLTNVPDIVDVRIMAELLRRLGCDVTHNKSEKSVSINVPSELGHRADYELVRLMRASISVLGPLTGRCRRADVAVPGGDAIGSRGLDLHIEGLRALGATVDVDHGYLVTDASQGLTGANITLAFPSVGATENIVMAAVLADGTTVLDNVAREPEITDLVQMLISMGAKIHGAGSSTLTIEGVQSMHPVTHHVVPDRIVTGTWAFAAATTGSEFEILGVEGSHLSMALDKLRAAGASVKTTDRGIVVIGPPRPKPVDIATFPYPGFATDLQPFALAMCAVADGASVITENLFEARFRFADEMVRLGARFNIDGHHVLVTGQKRLSGAPVEASDIRAGAALVIAGLIAEGVTEVRGVDHIDRGYENMPRDLQNLGARVELVDEEVMDFRRDSV